MNFKPFAEELGIDKLPQDQQESIYKTLLETLQMRVSKRMENELTDEQKKQLEAAAKSGDEAVMEALKSVYPNIAEVYQEELDKLKEEYKVILPMIK